MKIKSGYLVHEVAGNFVVIKIGQEAVKKDIFPQSNCHNS